MTNWNGDEASGWSIPLFFPLDAKLHIPGECGRTFDSTVPAGTKWSPGLGLRASAIVVEQKDQVQRYWIEDTRHAFQTIELQRLDTGISAVWHWRAATSAPPGTGAIPPEIHSAAFGSTTAAWRDYRTIMNRLWPMDASLWPSWSEAIHGIVLIEMWASSGIICNTFEDLTKLVSAMKAARVPAHTLIHFWGWNAPYDTRYPDYQPAAELGGPDGMARFCMTALDAGYHPMPHANFWGCDAALPLYERIRNDQVCDRWGNRCGWRVEGTPSIEYIRPDSAAWRGELATRFQALQDDYGIDAVFMDQYGAFIDDPGCDFEAASAGLAHYLRDACPGMIFSGEVIHERNRMLPVYQLWGTPWCGTPFRDDLGFSDAFAHLFSEDVRITPHMGYPSALPLSEARPAYKRHIAHYGQDKAYQNARRLHERLGGIPTVRVGFREHGLDEESVRVLTRQSLRCGQCVR